MRIQNLLLVALGFAISLFGLYSLLVAGENSSFIFLFGGIVVASVGAGLIGRDHSKGSGDAG